MKKTSLSQIVIVSDTHVGSTIGLCAPEMHFGDGGSYKATPLQLQGWAFWNKFWTEVHSRAKTRETLVVLNGDLVDGNHHGTVQLFTNNPDEQINLAAELLKPIADRYPVYVTRGTAAHVGPSASADEQIARLIGAKRPDPKQDARSSFHLDMEYKGVLFDIAHHGPGPGTNAWSYGNAMRTFVRGIVLDAKVDGRRPPDVVVSSHVHQYVIEPVDTRGHLTYGVITPAWQWKTEYGHKVVRKQVIADVGGVIITVENGKLACKPEAIVLPVEQTKRVRIP